MAAGTAYVIGPDECVGQNDTQAAVGASAGWSDLGIVTGGAFQEESEAREQRGVGDYKPHGIREGIFRCWGNANFNVQSLGILDDIIRDSGTGRLPEFALVAGNRLEYTIHNYCKMDTLSLEATAGGEVVANLAWRGRQVSWTNSAVRNITGIDGSPAAYDTQMWYGADVAFSAAGAERGAEGGTLQIIGFRIDISNNLEWLPVLTTGVTPQRGAKYVREGNQVVGVTLRVLVPENIALNSLALAYIASITFNFTNEAQTIQVQATNLMRGGQERRLTPGDVAEHGLTYVATDISIT